MVRALITGGTGFLGSYMAQYLAEEGVEVTATRFPGLSTPAASTRQTLGAELLDVTDREAVKRVVERVHPDFVYHFAGQAFVIPSWADPAGTFTTNLMGTLNLLEAVRHSTPRAAVGFAGSGTEYGAPDHVPTSEDSPLRPTSPYAASKAAADLLCYQYFASFGVRVVRYRIFGTTGPGKRGDSTNDFASQVAEAERRPPPGTIRVGNLDKERDITDVRDAVRAMAVVCERGEPGQAYNIGSGISRNVRATLDTLLSLARIPIVVQPDPSRIRLVDEPVHLADVSRLRGLGWTPRIPFEQTLRDILDHWRGST